MIGLSRLKRAIEDVPTGGMQTGDLKVRLKLCDAQRLEVEYGALIAERDAALAQNAKLVAQVSEQQSFIESVMANIGAGATLAEVTDMLSNWYDTKVPTTQHLLNIQAEAGRAGFVAGAACARHPITPKTDEIHREANRYAERVKAGE